MRQMQNEALRLIEVKIERLRKAADAAAQVLRSAQQVAAEARMAYRAAPADSTERTMWKAAMRADMELENSRSAEEAVKTGLAAHELIMAALREEEQEKGKTA